MKEIEAKGSISSIIDVVKSCDIKGEIWFRGQSHYIHDLIPSIFRKDSFYCESRMYEEFIRRYPEHSKHHKNVFEWLTLMQHYGLPTRLLDWTTNLLVALFFCCTEEKYKDKDGSIFVYDSDYSIHITSNNEFKEFLGILVTSPDKHIFYQELIKLASNKFGDETKINGASIEKLKIDDSHFFDFINDPKIEFNSFEEILNIPDEDESLESTFERKGEFSNIYSFKAPHLNPRIRQQHGCFTFHGGKYFGKSEFIATNRLEDRKSLFKIKIKSVDKENLLKELALSGINEATLFPEMEYQAKQIKELFKIM